MAALHTDAVTIGESQFKSEATYRGYERVPFSYVEPLIHFPECTGEGCMVTHCSIGENGIVVAVLHLDAAFNMQSDLTLSVRTTK